MVACALFVFIVLLASVHTTARAAKTKDEKKEKNIFRPPSLQPVARRDCPASCDEVFRKLECGQDCEMGLWQRVDVQERGGRYFCVPCARPYSFSRRFFPFLKNTWGKSGKSVPAGKPPCTQTSSQAPNTRNASRVRRKGNRREIFYATRAFPRSGTEVPNATAVAKYLRDIGTLRLARVVLTSTEPILV